MTTGLVYLAVFYLIILIFAFLFYVHGSWLYIINNKLVPLIHKYDKKYSVFDIVIQDSSYKMYTDIFSQIFFALSLGFLSKKRSREYIIKNLKIPEEKIVEKQKFEEIMNMLVWRSMVSHFVFTTIFLFIGYLFIPAIFF